MNNINILSTVDPEYRVPAADHGSAVPAKPKAPSAGTRGHHVLMVDGSSAENPALRKAFDQFVGETFYGQMLQAMRKSQSKPAYFNGGRAEEVFSQQLDQALTKKLAETNANKLSGPMYQLFTQQRK